MNSAIIIPARYGSTRFPGKPLALLKGRAVLEHVVDHAREAASDGTSLHVATDDSRIADFCAQKNIPVLMTPLDLATGTDRCLHAARQLTTQPDFIINLQGDAPFTPPDFIKALLNQFQQDSSADMITPVTRLTWDELDALRDSKKTTPFSGTTAVLKENGRALWFSKNILPAIRKEERSEKYSPVYRHIGLYGFSFQALERFVSLPPSPYETLEGLEQLRFLENGMSVQTVLVDYKGRPAMTGIDSPEDLVRAEKLLT